MQQNASQLVSCIQVSIAITANLIVSYTSTGRGSLLARQSDRIAHNRPLYKPQCAGVANYCNLAMLN